VDLLTINGTQRENGWYCPEKFVSKKGGTLLVNSAAANLQRHAGEFRSRTHWAFRAFKRHIQDHLSIRF
jgi:hypothetical protein